MTYNIAFSSSGALFAAHIGILAYLQDKNIKIKNFSGSSGGAVVACWGANGLPARELLNLTLEFGYTKFFLRPSLKFGGVLDHSKFGEIISGHCVPKQNLWIVTFNVLKMQKEIWNGKGYDLSKILTATTCVPVLFKPVVYSNGLHIDGIFASFCPDNLWHAEPTISVNLKCKKKTKHRYPFDKFVHNLEKVTIDFLEDLQKSSSSSKNVIYLNPDLSSISQTDLFVVSSSDHIELFKLGYAKAKEVMDNCVLSHSV